MSTPAAAAAAASAGTERSNVGRAVSIAISSAVSSRSASRSGGAASLVARAAMTVTSGGTSSEYRTPLPSSQATTYTADQGTTVRCAARENDNVACTP